MNWPDGIIQLDTPLAQELRFTSDRFQSSYLWKEGDRIMVSMIWATEPGHGFVRELFQAIEAHGWKVAVPTPSARMQSILTRNGYALHYEHDPLLGEDVDVWEKP